MTAPFPFLHQHFFAQTEEECGSDPKQPEVELEKG